MNKSLLFVFLFLFTFFSNSVLIKSEYGYQGNNRYLSGLGIAASYVGVPSQTVFNQNVDGAIDMWVYPTNLSSTYKTLISKGANLGVSFLWSIGSDGRMLLRIGMNDFINTGGIQVPINTWTHVAVTWAGGPNYTIRFYVNGAKSGSDITGNATWSVNSDPIRIGSSQAFLSNYFIGYIDEVRYWSFSIPQWKIIANKYNGIGDYPGCNASQCITSSVFYSDLISSWTFNSTSTAQDEIGGYHGTYYGGATSVINNMFTPIPYNFTLKLPGTSHDYITVANNSNLSSIPYGSIELWFKPTSFAAEQILVSKGSSASNLSMILGVAVGGKMYFGYGTNIVQNLSGAGLTLNQWNHICVTWYQNANVYTIRFYKNGKLNGSPGTITGTIPANTSPLMIGNSTVYNLPAKGWMDEFRLWVTTLSESDIQKNMFNTINGMSNSYLIAAYNFDGNLVNRSSTGSVMNATFNNSYTNNCRFSGYQNDSTLSAPDQNLISHSTTINRTGSPYPFPNGYNIKTPFLAIPDASSAGVGDSILIVNSNNLITNVELFLSIDHTYVGDLAVLLTAPNGTYRYAVLGNGGSGKNILSFFNDDFPLTLTTNGYRAPWGFVKPNNIFSNFNNSVMSGWWKIRVVDSYASDVGVLEGWGLRFNNVVDVKTVFAEIPKQYALHQNYPNPFNPETNINFDIPKETDVQISVFDMTGREVDVLLNEVKKPGSYSITYDASKLSSGTYFYRIMAGSFTETKRMVLIK